MEAEPHQPLCARCAQETEPNDQLAHQLIVVCEAKRLQQCKRRRATTNEERQLRVPVHDFKVQDMLHVAQLVLAHRDLLGEPVFDVCYELRFLVISWEDRDLGGERSVLFQREQELARVERATQKKRKIEGTASGCSVQDVRQAVIDVQGK